MPQPGQGEDDMKISREQLRDLILQEADSDGDGRSDKQELEAIARSMSSDVGDDPDYVTLTASDGESIPVHKDLSGMDTGWAVIGNPYYRHPPGHPDHDPDWRSKDGETVIGVEEGTPGAMSIADAYQEYEKQGAKERLQMDKEAISSGYEE